MEWQAYVSLEPFNFDTELRDDWRAAAIRETISNGLTAIAGMFVRRGFRPKFKQVKDFLISFDQESQPKKQGPIGQKELYDKLSVLSVMMGGNPAPPNPFVAKES